LSRSCGSSLHCIECGWLCGHRDGGIDKFFVDGGVDNEYMTTKVLQTSLDFKELEVFEIMEEVYDSYSFLIVISVISYSNFSLHVALDIQEK
jgi:hypothetical protein